MDEEKIETCLFSVFKHTAFRSELQRDAIRKVVKGILHF